MVKVVVYNLDGRMQYPAYQKMITELLASLHPDVVLLQEIYKWSHVQELAQELGMHCDRGAWHAGGHAVLSLHPIVATWQRVIPRAWYNALVGAQIAVPVRAGKPKLVWFFSVHLIDVGYKRDETERLRETTHILANLPTLRVAILAGDFNSVSHLDAPTRARLPSHLLEEAGWTDVQAGKKWTRSTWIPTDTLSRIDRIYTRGAVRVGRGAIVDHRDLGLARWPTGRDHRLLIQNFEI